MALSYLLKGIRQGLFMAYSLCQVCLLEPAFGGACFRQQWYM